MGRHIQNQKTLLTNKADTEDPSGGNRGPGSGTEQKESQGHQPFRCAFANDMGTSKVQTAFFFSPRLKG